MSQHFDYLVIGAGSGGISSARWAATKLNKKVGIIEHKRLGGTCVNVGCIPKKIMYCASQFLEDAESMDYYGIQPKMNFDWKVLKQSRDTYIARLNVIYEDLLKTTDYIKGFAEFIDNKTVQVGDKKFSADHICIAVGTHPWMDENMPGIEHCDDSDRFFEWPEQPKECVVFGGGYIGVELAGILHSLGTKVTHIVRNEILNFLDTEVKEILILNMKIKKMDIRFKIKVTKVEKL